MRRDRLRLEGEPEVRGALQFVDERPAAQPGGDPGVAGQAIFGCAIVPLVARLTRRRLLAGAVPAIGASAALLQTRDGALAQTGGGADHGEHGTTTDHGITGDGGHAGCGGGRTVDH